MKQLFVCGCPRSGTTALAHLLNGHPAVAVLMERYKQQLTAHDAPYPPDAFTEARIFDFSDAATNLQPSAGARWNDHYEEMRAKFASSRLEVIGDKVPRYYKIFDRVEATFAQARWLFIVRDPLYVAASYSARARNAADSWSSERDFRRAPAEWNQSLRHALRLKKRLGDRLFIVRYEEVFSGALEIPFALCDFLEVDCDQQFVDRHRRMTSNWDARAAESPALTPAERAYVVAHADQALLHRVTTLSRTRSRAQRTANVAAGI